MSFSIAQLFRQPPDNLSLILGTSIATTLGIIAVTKLTFNSTPKKIIPSPRATTLPQIPRTEYKDLPYPPDAFPGSRDVTSPVCIALPDSYPTDLHTNILFSMAQSKFLNGVPLMVAKSSLFMVLALHVWLSEV
jgi:hypothetical protein